MVMPFKYLGAVLALGAGWWWYGETMSGWSLAGMAIVIICIVTNTVLKSIQPRSKREDLAKT
jgi:drug/metabolite transporter (DMT)-like permease